MKFLIYSLLSTKIKQSKVTCIKVRVHILLLIFADFQTRVLVQACILYWLDQSPLALISNFGMMTWHLFKLGIYSRPSVYFTGENFILSQSTNNKVIFLLFQEFLMKNLKAIRIIKCLNRNLMKFVFGILIMICTIFFCDSY